MFVTRKADYAIRCVLYLTLQNERLSTIEETAEAMHVPRTFMAKILQLLMKAGIVDSVRGIQGGFRLSKKPDEINLMEIIEIIQGPSALNICAVDKRNCDLSNTCVVHPVWMRLKKVVEAELRSQNFKDLARKAKK